jgi:hypothetical protein
MSNDELRQLLQEMYSQLWVANHEFVEINRWQGSIRACHAVAKFIRDAGLLLELANPFLHIEKAFEDLLNGKKNTPLFSKFQEPSQRHRSGERKHLQNFAAALLEIMIERGETQLGAAKRIARGAKGWPGFPKTVKAVTVINWRKKNPYPLRGTA